MSGYRPSNQRWGPYEGRREFHPGRPQRHGSYERYSSRSPLCRDNENPRNCAVPVGRDRSHSRRPTTQRWSPPSRVDGQRRDRSWPSNNYAGNRQRDINNNQCEIKPRTYNTRFPERSGRRNQSPMIPNRNSCVKTPVTMNKNEIVTKKTSHACVSKSDPKHTNVANKVLPTDKVIPEANLSNNNSLVNKKPEEPADNSSHKINAIYDELSTSTDRHLLSGSDLGEDGDSSLLDFDDSDVKSDGGCNSPTISTKKRIPKSQCNNLETSQSSGAQAISETNTATILGVSHLQDSLDYSYLSQILDKPQNVVTTNTTGSDLVQQQNNDQTQPNDISSRNVTDFSIQKTPAKEKQKKKKSEKKSFKVKLTSRKSAKRVHTPSKKSHKKAKRSHHTSLVAVKKESSDSSSIVNNIGTCNFPVPASPARFQPPRNDVDSCRNDCDVQKSPTAPNTAQQDTQVGKDPSLNEQVTPSSVPSQNQSPSFEQTTVPCDETIENTGAKSSMTLEEEDQVMRELLEEQRYHIEQIKRKAGSVATRNKPQEEVQTDNHSLNALDSEYEWLNMYAPEEDSVSLYATNRLPRKTSQNKSDKAKENVENNTDMNKDTKKSIDLMKMLLDFETQSQTQMAAEMFFQVFIGCKEDRLHDDVISVSKRLATCLKKFHQFEYLEKLVTLNTEMLLCHNDEIYLSLFENLHQQTQKTRAEKLLKLLEDGNLIGPDLTRKLTRKDSQKQDSAQTAAHQIAKQIDTRPSSARQKHTKTTLSDSTPPNKNTTRNKTSSSKQLDNQRSKNKIVEKPVSVGRGSNKSKPVSESLPTSSTLPSKNKERSKVTTNQQQRATREESSEATTTVAALEESECNSDAGNHKRPRPRGNGLLPTPDMRPCGNLLGNLPVMQKNANPVSWSAKHNKNMIKSPMFDPKQPSQATRQAAFLPRERTKSLELHGYKNMDCQTQANTCEAYDPTKPAITPFHNNRVLLKNGLEQRSVNKLQNKFECNDRNVDWEALGRNFAELISTIACSSNEDNIMSIFISAMVENKSTTAICFAKFVDGAQNLVKKTYPSNLSTVEKCLSRIAVSVVYQCNHVFAYDVITYMRKHKMNYTCHTPVNISSANPCNVAMKFIKVCMELRDYFTASEIAFDFFVGNESMTIGPIQGRTISELLEAIAHQCVLQKMFGPAIKCVQSIPVAHCSGSEIQLIQEVLISLLQIDSKQFDQISTVADLMLCRNQLSSMRTIFNNSPINEMTLYLFKYLEGKGIYCCPRIAQRPHLVFIPYTMGHSEMVLTLYRHFTELSLFLMEIKERMRLDLPLRIVVLKDVRNFRPLCPDKPVAEQYVTATNCLTEVLHKIMIPPLIVQSQREIPSTNEVMLNLHTKSVRDWLIKNTKYTEM